MRRTIEAAFRNPGHASAEFKETRKNVLDQLPLVELSVSLEALGAASRCVSAHMRTAGFPRRGEPVVDVIQLRTEGVYGNRPRDEDGEVALLRRKLRNLHRSVGLKEDK
jgi:hypothetical protein